MTSRKTKTLKEFLKDRSTTLSQEEWEEEVFGPKVDDDVNEEKTPETKEED